MVEGAEAEGTIRMVVACGPYGPDAGVDSRWGFRLISTAKKEKNTKMATGPQCETAKKSESVFSSSEETK